MKSKTLHSLLTILFLGFVSMLSHATVTKTVGGSEADYENLKAAFDAINADVAGAVFTEDVELQVVGDVTEGEAILTTANSSWTSLKIYPVGESRTISYAGSAYAVELQGVKQVTFDGRLHDASGVLTGSDDPALIFNSVTLVMSLNADASNNTISYCVFKGVARGQQGLIAIENAQSSGNNQNTITHNEFTTDDATPYGQRPFCMISIEESESFIANHQNVISNNNFYNFLRADGIRVLGENTETQITGNSFYETLEFNDRFNSTILRVEGGMGHVISGNYFGGSEPECGGLWFSRVPATANNTHHLFCMNLKSQNLIIENNVFKNIEWKTAGTAQFMPIRLNQCNFVDVINNKIIDINIEAVNLGIGIESSNSSYITVDKNFIYNFSSLVNGTRIFGIRNQASIGLDVKNNVVSLGGNFTNSIHGILDNGETNIYFNTVYIYGDPSSGGPQYSYALNSVSDFENTNIKNNIFVNNRSNEGAEGAHYAAGYGYIPTTQEIDYNLYFVEGMGGVLFNAAETETATLELWQAISAKDVNSYHANPLLGVNSDPLAYKATGEFAGVSGTDVSDDFEGNDRSESDVFIGAFSTAKSESSTPQILAGSSIKIYQNATGIIVPLNKPSVVELYSAIGTRIDRVVTDGSYAKELGKGVYIIRVNDKSRKFVH